MKPSNFGFISVINQNNYQTLKSIQMKKLFSVLFALSIVFSLNLQAQDLEEILENHFDVVGQDKLLKINTIKTIGNVVQGGMELPFTMYMSRPMKFRMEISIQGQQIIQAFDGESGWLINPMAGTLDPQDMGPDELKQMKEQADMDGELYNYKEKGSTLELIGTEEAEGTEVYNLKLTKENGDVSHYFIDTETYIILKTTTKRMIQGVEIEGETILGNYQMIDGMAFPFSISTGMNGQIMVEIVITEFIFDVDMDDDFFSKPKPQD